MMEIPTTPPTTPPTIAPTSGPLLDDAEVVVVMPDKDASTQDAEAQESQDAATCRHTSFDLQGGHVGGSFGQTKHRLKRWEESRTEIVISDLSGRPVSRNHLHGDRIESILVKD